MFDKDITIINKFIENHTPKYKVSYVKGYWSSKDGISLNGTQITKSDSLYSAILMSENGYQKPKDFQENHSGWTLKNDDYLIKGLVKDFSTITKLLEDYNEVIKITNIATKDYGSKDMWHWVITGE